MQVLLVEDEAIVARGLTDALRKSGLAVDLAKDGEDAWYLAGTGQYAAIILDLGLPRIDGMTVMKRLRSEGVTTPILILSARGSWAERVDGINAGADDYLPKPFQTEELLARVHGLIRRSSGMTAAKLSSDGLEIDPASATVTIKGVPVELTQMEYRLLYHLVSNAGKVVPAAVLAETLYSHHHERDTNAIEVLVGRLRRKVGKDYIATRRGFGYFFKGSEET
ncbi:MAG: response regulator transcription factor [Aestuariivirga sp.]|uniref:response regulator transcription factor n=1 Tax=Aestuariivirga sp. TaxID=2650926 RepID=UPI0030199E5A